MVKESGDRCPAPVGLTRQGGAKQAGTDAHAAAVIALLPHRLTAAKR